jgi:hypothetical protein
MRERSTKNGGDVSNGGQQHGVVAHLVAHDILQRRIGGHPSRNREETAREQTRKAARKHLEEKKKRSRGDQREEERNVRN